MTSDYYLSLKIKNVSRTFLMQNQQILPLYKEEVSRTEIILAKSQANINTVNEKHKILPIVANYNEKTNREIK